MPSYVLPLHLASPDIWHDIALRGFGEKMSRDRPKLCNVMPCDIFPPKISHDYRMTLMCRPVLVNYQWASLRSGLVRPSGSCILHELSVPFKHLLAAKGVLKLCCTRAIGQVVSFLYLCRYVFKTMMWIRHWNHNFCHWLVLPALTSTFSGCVQILEMHKNCWGV